MNRTESLALWRRVAAGDLERPQEDPVDLHAWIREIARQLLDVDGDTSKSRSDKIVSAVGLAGKKDGYADLRALVDDPIWDFSALDDDGNPINETNGQTIRRMVDVARQQGLLMGGYEFDDTAARDLVRKLLKEPKQL